jgi:hypothetical protein
MSPWNALSTVALTVALCGIAVVALGCVWPAGPPWPVPRTRAPSLRAHHRVGTIPTSRAWTCALPGVPLDLDDAHAAMRHHRDHDCLRKRAAFATLVAHGCVFPDPTRRPYREKTLR